ncbi:hypothetical protein [Leisingera sp. ANG-S5]|uniref:hypothetical protein n=1 Tax=Leisingera sp. ANG-S5 TaxID=1577901 RepID=UPI00057FFCD5|nr:hypothetical protein [Leisingera sp. ANG-S5]KIC31554.1 hypothetical protein RA25_15680 [Leisingera sp. ANG-S5]
MEYVQLISDFASKHKDLISLIGVPLLSAIVAWFASVRATKITQKAQVVRRGLDRELKLSDYRQAWINELRNDLALLSSLSLAPNSGAENTIAFNAALSRILMRVNPQNPYIPELEKVVAGIRDYNLVNVQAKQDELVKVSRLVLKQEWERLKKDLRDTEISYESDAA